MKLRTSQVHGREKVELQMTPMIDIVFQLLVFFILTFKIVAVEGDFNIKMPKAAQGAPSDSLMVPLKLSLRAAPNGQLTGVYLGDTPFSGSPSQKFAQLQNRLIQQVGLDGGPGSSQEEAEIEIDADYHLHYRFVIEAMTAVSGRRDPETGEIQRLIEKVKFSNPKGG
jgi:biopolymer transport protein ExbD